MTEKSGVAYPPLSNEDLARYGGPPELEYLPLVSMANELIAARALMATGPFTARSVAYSNSLVRERAAVDRLRESIANEAQLRAEVERLTADLVEVEAKRRQAVEVGRLNLAAEQRLHSETTSKLAATEHAIRDLQTTLTKVERDLATEQKVHAETHRQLAQSNADHNALLLHLHAIREAAGIPLGDWGVQAGDWGSVASTVSERLRDNAALLGRLEALCHRLEDNDVPVTAETPTWIGYLEAGIAKLIEQRDGACSRREAEETARIKADANAVFEAQRTDLATALGMTGDWNTLVRGAVQLRRLHAELTTELIAIDRALEGGPQTSATNRAMRIRDILSILGERRRQIQDATKKLCKALGIADTATLAFAVETAVGLIGETPRREPKAAPASWADTTHQLGEREAKLEAGTSQLIAATDPHASLPDAPEVEVLRVQLVQATQQLQSERVQHDAAPKAMSLEIAKLKHDLELARDRIKALEEHNQEMHESVAMALGRERGGAGVGWKDLISDIERQGADLREARQNAEALTAELASIDSRRIAAIRVGIDRAKAYKVGGDSSPLRAETTMRIADALLALVELLGWS